MQNGFTRRSFSVGGDWSDVSIGLRLYVGAQFGPKAHQPLAESSALLYRGLAQLVARTVRDREATSSNLVSPTT